MNEDRKRILTMLSEGKITADEAERLLSAMDRPGSVGASTVSGSNGPPKYFRVSVDANDPHEGLSLIHI